jgi:hypothetical protein
MESEQEGAADNLVKTENWNFSPNGNILLFFILFGQGFSFWGSSSSQGYDKFSSN